MTVEIEVDMFFTFKKFLPPGNTVNPTRITVRDGVTVSGLAEALNVPSDVEMVVIVNGRYREGDYQLRSGDKVSIFPPINGG